jgi:hypothetical protein
MQALAAIATPIGPMRRRIMPRFEGGALFHDAEDVHQPRRRPALGQDVLNKRFLADVRAADELDRESMVRGDRRPLANCGKSKMRMFRRYSSRVAACECPNSTSVPVSTIRSKHDSTN